MSHQLVTCLITKKVYICVLATAIKSPVAFLSLCAHVTKMYIRIGAETADGKDEIGRQFVTLFKWAVHVMPLSLELSALGTWQWT